jgi:hypothetical protein
VHHTIDQATSAATYAGTVDHPSTGVATAYVTAAGAAALRAAVAGAGEQNSAKIVQVANSLQAVDQVDSEITNDQAAITKAGITETQWNPDVQSNTVLVEVTSNVAGAQAYMNATYGSGMVTVAGGGPVFKDLGSPVAEAILSYIGGKGELAGGTSARATEISLARVASGPRLAAVSAPVSLRWASPAPPGSAWPTVSRFHTVVTGRKPSHPHR